MLVGSPADADDEPSGGAAGDRDGSAAPEATPTAVASDRRALRLVLAAVFVLGTLHAGLYAVSFPPWAIEDEEQHVDYVRKLAFDRRLPELDDPLDQSVIDSAASTDRWGDYELARPPALTPDAMGFEGHSYEAYHPPLVYLTLAPVAWPLGDRALVAMYVLRGVSVLVAGAVCVVTALLAWTWCPDRSHARRPVVAAAAGLAAAALPAVADSGGRVDLDIYAALIVAAGALLVWRWLEGPTNGRAWAVGAVLAAGALSRETAYVVGVAVLVAGFAAVRRGTLRLGHVVRGLGPPAAAGLAWTVYFWRSSGHLDPSEALRDRLGAHHPYPGFGELVRGLGERALVPYGDWALPLALTLAVVAVAVAGLVLAARHGVAAPALAAGGSVVLAIALVVQQALEGSTTVTARLLLPAYPLAIAAATVGWSRLRHPAAALALPAITVLFAVTFLAGSFLPTYPPALG